MNSFITLSELYKICFVWMPTCRLLSSENQSWNFHGVQFFLVIFLLLFSIIFLRTAVSIVYFGFHFDIYLFFTPFFHSIWGFFQKTAENTKGYKIKNNQKTLYATACLYCLPRTQQSKISLLCEHITYPFGCCLPRRCSASLYWQSCRFLVKLRCHYALWDTKHATGRSSLPVS